MNWVNVFVFIFVHKLVWLDALWFWFVFEMIVFWIDCERIIKCVIQTLITCLVHTNHKNKIIAVVVYKHWTLNLQKFFLLHNRNNYTSNFYIYFYKLTSSTTRLLLDRICLFYFEKIIFGVLCNCSKLSHYNEMNRDRVVQTEFQT